MKCTVDALQFWLSGPEPVVVYVHCASVHHAPHSDEHLSIHAQSLSNYRRMRLHRWLLSACASGSGDRIAFAYDWCQVQFPSEPEFDYSSR